MTTPCRRINSFTEPATVYAFLMRLLGGTVVLVTALLLAGCGGEDDAAQPSGSGSATSSASEDTQPDQTPDPEPSKPEGCLSVKRGVAQQIASARESGTGMKAGPAAAVKSPDFENVYFVAMRFKAMDIEDQVGVWATNSLKPRGAATIMAVDGFAQQFTTWPDADKTGAAISSADPSADAANACLD